MRLDKFLSDTASFKSRSEAARAVRSGNVTVNGKTEKSAAVHIDAENDIVCAFGKQISFRRYTYIMLSKPAGYISSTETSGKTGKTVKTVMELLPPECLKMKMFPCGRLDIDTTGLLLITNNGPLAHRLLSPRYHVFKTYAYKCSPGIDSDKARLLEEGVDIGGHVSLPAKIEMRSPSEGAITLREGKFHQIKRMFEAVGSRICALERTRFGPLVLDGQLSHGEWRYLTEDEEKSLFDAASLSGGEDRLDLLK